MTIFIKIINGHFKIEIPTKFGNDYLIKCSIDFKKPKSILRDFISNF
jgi:hypothetical protein